MPVRGARAWSSRRCCARRASPSRSSKNSRSPVKARDQIDFLNLVAVALDDDFLGARLALLPDLREAGLIHYVIASSATLAEALQRAARYGTIVNESCHAALH